MLKSDMVEEYKKLHASPWPEVLKTIHDCNLRNYSIFIQDNIVFSYFEYIGSDYDADMQKMENDPYTQKWWKHTKPCFQKFAFAMNSEFYHDMTRIFYIE